MKHGTKFCYNYHACRCDPCRAANNLHNRLSRLRNLDHYRQKERKQERRRNRNWMDKSPHDREAKYQSGCRCMLCRGAHYRYLLRRATR